MSDHIDELCALVKEAGGTMRLYGKPVTPEQLRGAVTARVTARLARILTTPPAPSTSATIDHTAPGFGKVTVAGYHPARVDYEPVEYSPRPKAKCARCGIEGHIASNQRLHPDPERLDRAAARRARLAPPPSKARDTSQASAERFLARRATAGAP